MALLQKYIATEKLSGLELKSHFETKFNIKYKKNDKLYMLYTDYDDNETYECKLKNEIRKICNGIILEKDTNKIVCYGVNKPTKVVCDLQDSDSLSKLDNLKSDSASVEAYTLTDGAIIKVFYYDGKWNFSTSRCISAFNSYWTPTKSFGEMFVEALSLLQLEQLDKNCTHLFVLMHPEHRVVKKYHTPQCNQIHQRNMSDFKETWFGPIGEDIPDIREMITNRLSVSDYTDPGMLVVVRERGACDTYQVINKKYQEYVDLKGNQPNYIYRYLELIRLVVQEKVTRESLGQFFSKFPEYDKGPMLDILFHSIHKTYMWRFVSKRINNVYQHYHRTIYELHGIYLETKSPITMDTVRKYIMGLDPAVVTSIISKDSYFFPHKYELSVDEDSWSDTPDSDDRYF